MYKCFNMNTIMKLAGPKTKQMYEFQYISVAFKKTTVIITENSKQAQHIHKMKIIILYKLIICVQCYQI